MGPWAIKLLAHSYIQNQSKQNAHKNKTFPMLLQSQKTAPISMVCSVQSITVFALNKIKCIMIYLLTITSVHPI